MYSLMLLSAVASGGETPSFGGGFFSGSSCTGVVVSTGCGGCCGGLVARPIFPLFPGIRSRLAARFSCSGCYGASCHGTSCYGSSCYGSSCLGSSCHGTSCYGSSSLGYGFGGCQGSISLGYNFAGMPTFPQGYSNGGCYGTGVVGPYYFGADFIDPPLSSLTPSVPAMPPAVNPDLNRSQFPDYRVAQAKPSAAPARLAIELPADAELFVDGEKVTGTGPIRNFHTPDLPAGTFFYDLMAVVKVDGESVTEVLKVTVKGGDVKTESFGKLIAAVKSAKSPAVVAK